MDTLQAGRTVVRTGRGTLLPLALLGLVLAVSIVVATGLGPVQIAPGATARMVLHHLSGGGAGAAPSDAQDAIVWMIRLPRVLLGAIVGAALAVVGVALQAATANRLADPHLLGVSSGATLGAVAATLWFGAAFGPLTLPAMAFAGALAAMALAVALGARAGRLDSQRLLLSGISVSFVMMALANLLLYLGDQRAASSVLFWMLGGLGLARWDLLGAPALFAAGGMALLAARRRELDALMSGDVAAVTLGVDVARVRREVFVVSSLVTAAMVAVSGAIGFVGLVAPHVCRRMVGAGHVRLLPASALFGAVLLVWADVAARMLAAPDDLPIGVVTSLFGGACLVWLVRGERT
ncbi:FecCD family ABC transporter permease [Burkholderia multivorans]|uniref:ABC transporter permease n=1 Tax=Burkholderia multivorans TaxID=87883 RepID=A0AB37ASF8_9BURK|nr:iron ABC transporter permease [Burkholderia multivorans]PRE45450.1 ABC transporter permease [Burkholderia multivorans]PRE52138.1 ABC transporter permease [Burkholderia multivorans]